MMTREGRVDWLSGECLKLSQHPLHQLCLVAHMLLTHKTACIRNGRGRQSGGLMMVCLCGCSSARVIPSLRPVLGAFWHSLVPSTHSSFSPPTRPLDGTPQLSDSSSLQLPLQVTGFPLDSASPAVQPDDCSLHPQRRNFPSTHPQFTFVSLIVYL